ncbi:hypothetical protein B296_00028384 [Ensete ventricosum]|uniref:Uncharacterized protein n=1 Tax=Ensete ventricosum TaxID=4639 RepID=A0A426ZIQ5_ENSVE|nr:hypothetical protein B296_00028384 [Ensete ventricosum]
MRLDAVWGCQEPFPTYLEEISVCVELRGVVGGREWLKSGPSILLLDGPEAGPRGCSVRGRFCSLRFSTIRVSATMKSFALCIISRTMVGGGQENPNMSASDKSYNAIWARKAATCSVGSELPSYDSKMGNLKLVGTSLSCISGAKGDLCLGFFPSSSFDLVTSFYTSSSRLFTRRSCIRNELVESDDMVSDSRGVCSSPRCKAVDFSGTIEGVADWASGEFCSVGPGRVGAECSRDSLWLVGGRWGSGCGGGVPSAI